MGKAWAIIRWPDIAASEWYPQIPTGWSLRRNTSWRCGKKWGTTSLGLWQHDYMCGLEISVSSVSLTPADIWDKRPPRAWRILWKVISAQTSRLLWLILCQVKENRFVISWALRFPFSLISMACLGQLKFFYSVPCPLRGTFSDLLQQFWSIHREENLMTCSLSAVLPTSTWCV